MPDRLALVVVDFLSRANPARISDRRFGIGEVERAGLRLNFGLCLTAKTVGIGKMQLNLGLRPRCEIAHMGFAGDRCRADRDAFEVIEDARRCGAEICDGERARVRRVEKRRDIGRGEIHCEGVEGIAFDRPGRLSTDGCSRQHAQGIETGLGAITIWIGDHLRLQHAVAMLGGRLIAGGVERGDGKQII